MSVERSRRTLTARVIFCVTLVGITLGCDGFLTSLDDFGFTPSPYDTSASEVLLVDILPIISEPAVAAGVQDVINGFPGATRAGLTTLYVNGPIASLEDVRLFPDLLRLALIENGLIGPSGELGVESLDPLRSLTSLRELEISRNGLTDQTLDLIPGGWPELGEIILHENGITNMGAVADLMIRLQEPTNGRLLGLRLDNNPLDGATMGEFSRLTSVLGGLSVIATGLDNMEWFPETPNELRFVDVSGNTFVGSIWRLFFYAPSLNQLYASDLSLTSIAEISRLTDLNRVVLTNNPNLTDGVAELAQLPNLEWIYLQGIGLDDSHPDIQAVIAAHGATANELFLPSGILYVPPSP